MWIINISKNNWIKDFSLNLFGNVTGILLVVFLIDWILELNHKREKDNFENIALRQIRRPLTSQLDFLFTLYKATSSNKPTKISSKVSDLFTEDFFAQIIYLDFSKQAPVYPFISYYDYCFQEVIKFKEGLSRILDRYSIYLSAEIIELIEQINNSGFIFFMISFKTGRDLDNRDGIKRHPACLSGSGIIDVVKEYVTLIKKLVGIIEKNLDIRNGIEITTHDWRDDVTPGVGSGRIEETG